MTGEIVNIRTGPGLGFDIVGLVAGGDQLRVVGRAAAHDAQRIEHPSTARRTVWIYAALTDVDGMLL